MKRSITGKITISYFLVALLSLASVGVLYSFLIRAYLERQAGETLIKEAKFIADMYRNDLVNGNDTGENRIQKLLKDTFRIGRMGFESKGAIITRDIKGDLKVLYPRTGEDAEIFNNYIRQKIDVNMLKDKLKPFKISSGNTKYIAVASPMDLRPAASEKVGAWVVLYIHVDQVNQLTRGVKAIMFISIIFTGIIAVAFGFYMGRSVARPIVQLKKRAQMLAARDFDTRVEIKTDNELEDLAFTLDKMAHELKQYDMAQRRFLQNASHELKTPLMSIQGYAEGIKDRVFEDREHALDIIIEESARLKGIVEELIFLSKLETMEDFYKLEEVSINGIIEKSVEKVNSLAVKGNIRITQMLYKDANIKADGEKLIQALINILGNCLRHACNEISVLTSNTGEWFEISIYDDGQGFSEKDMNNLFERFYKGNNGDTGLGLAITKVIIEKHYGVIEASNNPGGGARFCIRIPISTTA